MCLRYTPVEFITKQQPVHSTLGYLVAFTLTLPCVLCYHILPKTWIHSHTGIFWNAVFPIQIIYSWTFRTHIRNTHSALTHTHTHTHPQPHTQKVFPFHSRCGYPFHDCAPGLAVSTGCSNEQYIFICMYKRCSLLKNYIDFCVSQYDVNASGVEKQCWDKDFSKALKLIKRNEMYIQQNVKSVFLSVFMISNKRNEIKMFN